MRSLTRSNPAVVLVTNTRPSAQANPSLRPVLPGRPDGPQVRGGSAHARPRAPDCQAGSRTGTPQCGATALSVGIEVRPASSGGDKSLSQLYLPGERSKLPVNPYGRAFALTEADWPVAGRQPTGENVSTRSGKLSRILGIVAVASLMATASASAATINFFTGDGGDLGFANVPLTPHPAWYDVNNAAGLPSGTSRWISYEDTGIGGVVAPNSPDANSNNVLDISEATAVFAREFAISGPGDFNLWILADDTATVVLSGPGGNTTLFTAPLRNSQVHPCMGSVIGCLEDDLGIKHLDRTDPRRLHSDRVRVSNRCGRLRHPVRRQLLAGSDNGGGPGPPAGTGLAGALRFGFAGIGKSGASGTKDASLIESGRGNNRRPGGKSPGLFHFRVRLLSISAVGCSCSAAHRAIT